MRKIDTPNAIIKVNSLEVGKNLSRDRPNPIKEQKVSPRQRAFIDAFFNPDVGGRDATKSAIAAGYSKRTAGSIGHQLLDPKRFPLVANEIKNRMDILDGKAMLDADGVLRYIHTSMLYRPLEWFKPSKDGGWMIDENQLMNLPPEIGCLIEEIESKSVVTRKEGDGTETTSTYLKVRLVSKTAMTALAAKYQLTQKHDVNVHGALDWDTIIESAEKRRSNNPIVARLAQVGREALMAPRPAAQEVVDMNGSANGESNGHSGSM